MGRELLKQAIRKGHRKEKGREAVVCFAPEGMACRVKPCRRWGARRSKELWVDFEREQIFREHLET